jgi:excisionase family DNA binding protein
MIDKSLEAYGDILTTEDFINFWGCSRATAWKIMQSKGFPKIQVGRTIRIPKAALVRWMEESAGVA